MTQDERRDLAREIAREVVAELGRATHRSPDGNLTIEVVTIDTLPATLRGGAAHG